MSELKTPSPAVEAERPTLLKGTPVNTPWWRRPSNGMVALGILTATAAEFPRFVENILPFVRDDWKPALRIASYACIAIGLICVRLGVTKADAKVEKLAARTEEKLNG